MSVRPIAPDMLAAIMADPAACASGQSDRDRQIIALRLASPKRADAGAPIEHQADAAHLPLFVAVNEPKLF